MVFLQHIIGGTLSIMELPMDNCQKCDKDIYENGTEVFFTHTIYADDLETWINKVAEESGQKVDWHYYAGRAII